MSRCMALISELETQARIPMTSTSNCILITDREPYTMPKPCPN